MKTYCLSFTDRGEELAKKLDDEIGSYSERCNENLGLSEWTEKAFKEADAIIYIGAAGIAVRAIAKHVVSKVTDPAVIVIDETGKFVISLLSGHLGGANHLAESIAKILGATPVITTATDRNGLFAVDEWSKRQNAEIVEPGKIKLVSSKILKGERLKVRSAFDINGEAPELVGLSDDGPDIELAAVSKDPEPLHVAPKIVHVGIGCRKGVDSVVIENAFGDFKRKTGLLEKSIVKLATIDIKQDEPGIREFCEFHGFDLAVFTAEELMACEGEFESSDFVKKVTGADNVCERAAKLSSGGEVIIGKTAKDGVTLAAAAEPYHPDWSWKDE